MAAGGLYGTMRRSLAVAKPRRKNFAGAVKRVPVQKAGVFAPGRVTVPKPDPSDASRQRNFQQELDMSRVPRQNLGAAIKSAPKPAYRRRRA